MRKIKKILIIVQRSNGDVLLSLSLINLLHKYYQNPQIDLLVNDDTLAIAKLLPNINFIHQFSYQKKRDNRWQQERDLIKSIFKKYDLSINLTASDRSIFYALFAGRKSISAIEKNHKSSWWKKIYPKHLRDELLKKLSTLGVPILITGCNNKIDTQIKATIPNLDNVFNWIGETTLEEYFALSELSLAYVGMDTLNMHIAAGQNKRIFAIYGPTRLSIWSPWSNVLQISATQDKPKQTYGNITIFQADMPSSMVKVSV